MKLVNFLAIFAVTSLLAGYAHWIRPAKPATTTDISGLPEIPARGIPLLRLADVKALHADPGTLFVDVRSASDFSFGRIAGAISVPEEDIEKRLDELRPRLTQAKAIVVYCTSRDCGKALWAGLRLRDAGFTQTAIFPDGWNEWYVDSNPIDR